MSIYQIIENKPIAKDTFSMLLQGDTSWIKRPGQFVNIKLDGLFLRRPISVCNWNSHALRLIYKVVGRGTAQMSAMEFGQTLDLLVDLGNGFDIAPAKGKKIAVVGGGVGVPPLFGLCSALKAAGENVFAVLGFQTMDAVFYEPEFKALSIPVFITTDDGSYGKRGFVTDILQSADYDYYFACGPEAMLRSVHKLGKTGQLSFEARMGCGFGACMGCSCKTLTGYKRICVDGPVMQSGEVSFDA